MLLALWACIFVFFWVGYYRMTHGALTRHIGFLHFTLYFFAIYVGSYLRYVEEGSTNDRYIYSVLLYPLLSLAGMVAAKAFGGRSTFLSQRMRTDKRELVLLWGIVAFFLGLLGVYLYSLGQEIPLIGVLRGGDLAASRLARYMATKGYSGEAVGGLRLFFWLPRLFVEYFASFTLVFAYYWAREQGKGFTRFLLIFAGLVFIALLQVEKYPAMKLFIVIAACHFNFKQPRLRMKSVAYGLVLAVMGVGFMGVVYGTVSGNYRGRENLSAIERVGLTFELGGHIMATRGMQGQAQALNATYKLVPDVYPFFGGRTLVNPKHILPYEPIVLPYLVSDSYLVNEAGTQGSDPTVFFGEVYANWGLIVSYVAMFLFGFFLQLVGRKLAANVDNDGSTWDVAYYYLIYLWFGDFALSFTSLYFDERLWFFGAVYILHSQLKRRWIYRERTAAQSPRVNNPELSPGPSSG